ncbi:hypothetical protein GCM10027610_136670 [Dactylosporangium cerinum]
MRAAADAPAAADRGQGAQRRHGGPRLQPERGQRRQLPQDRVSKAGYSGFSDELVAKGGDAGDVVKSWLRDDNDREILLDCATKSIGVGAAMRGKTPYWTVDTGRA